MKTIYQLIKNNLKLSYAVAAMIAIASLTACVGPFSERARSEKLFEQYCNEAGRVGQFIYERVALGPEFFRPIPTDVKELRGIRNIFYINNKKLLINEEYFDESYTFNYQERKVLSSTGPIYSVETTIVRKSDGKILSKAVSLINMLGLAGKYFPAQGVYYPEGRDIKGRSLFNKKHLNLMESTFSINN